MEPNLPSHQQSDLEFQQLPQVQPSQSLTQYLDTNIIGSTWKASHDCLIALRSLNKNHSQQVGPLLDKYKQVLVQIVESGKTVLVRCILRLINQTIKISGKHFDFCMFVQVLLPVVIKKAALEIGLTKQLAQEALTVFMTQLPPYSQSFQIISINSIDKNSIISQISLKSLSALIQTAGPRMSQLCQQSLTYTIQALSHLKDSCRNNIKMMALDICICLCGILGSENYVKLINFCLEEFQVQKMMGMMEYHRCQKNKVEPLSTALKKRKSKKYPLINHDEDFQWNH